MLNFKPAFSLSSFTPINNKKSRSLLQGKITFFLSFNVAVPGLSCSTWHLVSQPGVEPRPLALETWNLNYWTTREVLRHSFLMRYHSLFFHQVNLLHPPIFIIYNSKTLRITFSTTSLISTSVFHHGSLCVYLSIYSYSYQSLYNLYWFMYFFPWLNPFSMKTSHKRDI